MRHGSGAVALLASLLSVAGPGRAPGQAISRGFELERQGRLEQAATLYLGVLRGEPANVPALLGLERVLPALGRLPELLAPVQRALAMDSSPAVRSLALRAFTALEENDSAAALARRWAAARPGDPAPWREWAIALEDRQRFDEARNVLLEGRRTLGGVGGLAVKLAELEQRIGDWTAAALEWVAAAAAEPNRFPNAVSQLDDTPVELRDRVTRALLVSQATVAARRIAAELLLGWGQPERGWETLAATLDPPTPDGALALRRFADRATGSAPGTRRVRGLALARLADLMPGPLGARIRAEAARALVDAGERTAARGLLARLAGDPAAPAEAQALAQVALVEALIDDGQLDSASLMLTRLDAEAGPRGEDRARLRRSLAAAWMRGGRLERAEETLGADSSVDGLALRGWVRLYRGDLRGAVEAFRAAGPYAGDRDAATARTAMLALLLQIDVDRAPELGAALLQLGRGDSAGAVAGLRRAADLLSRRRGRADLLLLAGQIAARLEGSSHEGVAGELFAEAVRSGGTGAAAAAAELEWARLLLRQGKPTEAIAHLERLILTYPDSAVVPAARRELERARGAIPRS